MSGAGDPVKRTLHERVAARMALSESVGSYHSYEVILASLRRRYATEQELLEVVTGLEEGARLMGAPPGWKLLSDE
jgi:hypothetical protein